MTYEETLSYLYQQLPMFTRIGAAALKPNLDNTLALCRHLGQPQNQFKSIHIAGTNGKGSTSHMLAAVLQQAGYKTGLYTSPHLKDFRERIRINGQMIPQQNVVDFVAQHKNIFETIQPSFFEMTVALCFDYFAREKVDIAIIETGLGGRLDSTNVINPLLSIITNIGWDHTDLLGDTLDKIAAEKAGIIKQGVPVVVSEVLPETLPVFTAKANACKSEMLVAEHAYPCTDTEVLADGVRCSLPSLHHNNWKDVFCELGGIYQFKNIPAVIAATEQLQQMGMNIEETHVREGLAKVKQLTGLMGRWQTLQEHPRVICDVGHNSSGITYVLKQLQMQTCNKLHMVIGMVKDKDISKILGMLPKEATYYFCQPDLPRALDAAELATRAHAAGLNGTVIANVRQALATAIANAAPDDLIFAGGSTFVVAEIV